VSFQGQEDCQCLISLTRRVIVDIEFDPVGAQYPAGAPIWPTAETHGGDDVAIWASGPQVLLLANVSLQQTSLSGTFVPSHSRANAHCVRGG